MLAIQTVKVFGVVLVINKISYASPKSLEHSIYGIEKVPERSTLL